MDANWNNYCVPLNFLITKSTEGNNFFCTLAKKFISKIIMIEFDTLIIDNDKKDCIIDNNAIKLTKSEFRLLSYLLNNRNKIFSREELIKVAWSEPVTQRAVDTAISRLRKKLNKYGKHITSRIGFGYGFMEEI